MTPPEQRFRALNSQRIERLRAALDAPARHAFDALPDRLLGSAGADVLGLYLMGSAGTFGQGHDSDLDLWVVCGQDADQGHLDQALQQETDRCRLSGLDVRAFLVNPLELRAGNRSALEGDDCGSTQDRLLLDEFYRTAVLLRGAAPLWWLIAPDDEARYDELAPALATPAYLDLGGIPAIPEDEFLGATLWHLHKAIDAPHKSLLKLLLLEAYALDGGEPLALAFKRRVFDPGVNLDGLDPYLLMYERIEAYLERRRDPRRLQLARVCLLRKAESSSASAWQRRHAAALRTAWGWTQDDPPAHPDVDALLHEHAEIARQLDTGHTLLRQWADAMPARFAADRDLQLLEADLAVHALEWPGKVPRVNASLRRTLANSLLRLRRHDGGWSMHTESGAPLVQDPSLAHIVAWCSLNSLWPAVQPQALDAAVWTLLVDRIGELAQTSRADPSALLQPPAARRDLLFLLDEARWLIERVTLNSWGEVSTRSLQGLGELAAILPEVEADLVEVHAARDEQGARTLRELLRQLRPQRIAQTRVLVEGPRSVVCLESGQPSTVSEYRFVEQLLRRLGAVPMPTEVRGEGPMLAPIRALQGAWRAGHAQVPRAHLLLLPAGDDRYDDGLVLVDRDESLCWLPLPHRPLPHQQDALRLFLANAGRRLRIDTRAWIWGRALTPLMGRIYLPERVRVTQQAGGSLDLECGERVFRAIDTDEAAAAAARERILGLRADAADYPITITDVATTDPRHTPLRELLAIKLHAEQVLNRRLERTAHGR